MDFKSEHFQDEYALASHIIEAYGVFHPYSHEKSLMRSVILSSIRSIKREREKTRKKLKKDK